MTRSLLEKNYGGAKLAYVVIGMEKAGIDNFAHQRVTDQGMKKGQSPVTDKNSKGIADKGAALLTP